MALFGDVFLPEGYPSSVSSDYLSYQTWDTVQAFASSIAGSLATKVNNLFFTRAIIINLFLSPKRGCENLVFQAVLKGVGVGDESATALAATLTWLMRHGAGMVEQILFTWVQVRVIRLVSLCLAVN